MKKLLMGLVVVMLWGCGQDSVRRVDEGAKPSPASSASPEKPEGGAVATPGGPGTPAAPGTPEEPGQDAPEPVEPGAPAAEGRRSVLRLLGVGRGEYRSVLAQVRSVSVRVDGVPLAVELEGDVFELTRKNHAWKVGTFVLPEGAREVAIELKFDDFGGFETADAAGALDLRVPPLRFRAPASYFAEHAHAVVHLDLARSIRPALRGRLLLPDFQVQY